LIPRVILAAIAFVFGQLETDGDDIPDRLSIGRSLDFLFWFGVTAIIANALGAFELHDVEARGYDAIVPAMLALLWLGIKGVLFVLVPTFLLCAMLRKFESLVPRLVIYGVAASLTAWVYYRGGLSQAEAARIAMVEAQKQIAAEQALELERAEAAARKYDDEHHADYLKQLMSLAAQAHRRWQQDLQVAGTIGHDDLPPPFLSVTETTPHVKQVRNAAREPLCVKLVRTQRGARADAYHHCDRDLQQQCVVIAPGGSLAFSLPPDETAYGCHDSFLEYRIGDALMPGPSWWSNSAVQTLERDRPDFRAKYENLSASEIKLEIERIQALLAEPDRAARWIPPRFIELRAAAPLK
jgi:hypothetical protein